MPQESPLHFLVISTRNIPATLCLGPDLLISYNKSVFLPLNSLFSMKNYC